MERKPAAAVSAWDGRHDAAAAVDVGRGQRIFGGGKTAQRAGIHHLAAPFTGAGADVHDGVGGADGLFVVFDHDQGVALFAQPAQNAEQVELFGKVHADGGLVQDVDDAAQAETQLGDQAGALQLAAGYGVDPAVQGNIPQIEGDEGFQALDDVRQQRPADGAFAGSRGGRP